MVKKKKKNLAWTWTCGDGDELATQGQQMVHCVDFDRDVSGAEYVGGHDHPEAAVKLKERGG